MQSWAQKESNFTFPGFGQHFRKSRQCAWSTDQLFSVYRSSWFETYLIFHIVLKIKTKLKLYFMPIKRYVTYFKVLASLKWNLIYSSYLVYFRQTFFQSSTNSLSVIRYSNKNKRTTLNVIWISVYFLLMLQ